MKRFAVVCLVGAAVVLLVQPALAQQPLEIHDWQEAIHFDFWIIAPEDMDDFHIDRPRSIDAAGNETPIRVKCCSIEGHELRAPLPRCEKMPESAWYFFDIVIIDTPTPSMDIGFELPDGSLPEWIEFEATYTAGANVLLTETVRVHCDETGISDDSDFMDFHAWQEGVHFDFWAFNIALPPLVDDFHIENPFDPLDDGTQLKVKCCSIEGPFPTVDCVADVFGAWWVFPPVPPDVPLPPMDIMFSNPNGELPVWIEATAVWTYFGVRVAELQVTFRCEPVVPTEESSWGRIKDRYKD